MRLAICIATASFAFHAHANSFVGNGGGQGDVELSVTLTQIQQTLELVQKRAAETIALCVCTRRYTNRPICTPLKALDDTQSKFCADGLRRQTPALLKLLAERESIRFTWTSEPIEVREGGHQRAVDAVTDPKQREITVNLPRFLRMQPAERVFLLTHELMHLTEMDGKAMVDEGAVGPFAGQDGGRELLNAMATGAAVLQGDYPRDIKSYGGTLSRSQSWKSNWFDLDVGSASATSNYSDNFQFSQMQRYGLTYRYQWTNWGVVLNYRIERNEKTIFDTIDVTENESILGAGVSYRIFPFSDPLTYWGQSHIVLQGLADWIRADFKFDEDGTGASNSTSAFGGSFTASYFLPLWVGFWTYVGVGYGIHPFAHTISIPGQNVNETTNYNANLISGFIGVSYAF